MIDTKNFLSLLSQNQIKFICGVPDSLLKNLCAAVNCGSKTLYHVAAANEGCAIGMAVGHHLATGNLPCVYLQNSGLGNIINPLTSLADATVYSIPMLIVIGWRGQPGIHDEMQHGKMGKITTKLLETLGVEYIILKKDGKEQESIIKECISKAKESSRPVALLVEKSALSGDVVQSKNSINKATLTRIEAIKAVTDMLPKKAHIVSTTGMISRELYHLRKEEKACNMHDFMCVGSMGHASSIALGIALSRRDKMVVNLDGDGAMIMHLGSVAQIGYMKPNNLIHIVLNNGVHDSVGGQPTSNPNISFSDIASSCGYKICNVVSTKEEIKSSMSDFKAKKELSFLQIDINTGGIEGIGRPTEHAGVLKENFMSTFNESYEKL